MNIGVVQLRAQTIEWVGQEIEEGLIRKLRTFDLAAVLFIDGTQDLRRLGGAVVGEYLANRF